MTLVRMVRKTLFRMIVVSVKTCNRGERTGPTLNTATTVGIYSQLAWELRNLISYQGWSDRKGRETLIKLI